MNIMELYIAEPLEYTWIDIANLLINKMNLDLKKSLKVQFNKNDKQINSTLYPSHNGLLKSNLNEIF